MNDLERATEIEYRRIGFRGLQLALAGWYLVQLSRAATETLWEDDVNNVRGILGEFWLNQLMGFTLPGDVGRGWLSGAFVIRLRFSLHPAGGQGQSLTFYFRVVPRLARSSIGLYAFGSIPRRGRCSVIWRNCLDSENNRVLDLQQPECGHRKETEMIVNTTGDNINIMVIIKSGLNFCPQRATHVG